MQRYVLEIAIAVDDDWLAGDQHATDETFAGLELQSELDLRQPMNGFDLHDMTLRNVQTDRALNRAEQTARTREDAGEQRTQFEFARDLLEDRIERLAEPGRIQHFHIHTAMLHTRFLQRTTHAQYSPRAHRVQAKTGRD